MVSAVCTLFEDHFHKGVPALINSLYNNGFRGDYFMGFRGDLPEWTSRAIVNSDLNWTGAKTLKYTEDLKVHFLPVVTNYHLAHYKPDFMLSLLNGPAKNAEALVYFDSDIINLCNWKFYEKWMSYGVAMVHEIVSNDMPENHPTRMQWREVIKRINKEPKRNISSYINCGFCGVSRKNIEFLKVWKQIIDAAIFEYNMDEATFIGYDRTGPFYSIDQDAFNIAAMCCESNISEMGPEAMDFVGAGWTMSHATGWPKPWNNKFILSALKGNPPSRPHKHYWNNIEHPVRINSKLKIRYKKAAIIIATIIGRFYRRS